MQTFTQRIDFRTDKIRDDAGEVIGKGRKHPSIEVVLPEPTTEELVTLLAENEKVRSYLVSMVRDEIKNAAREQIDEWREANGLDKDFNPSSLNLDILDFVTIASTEKVSTSDSISDEDWTAFFEDYTNTMVKVVGYDPKKVALHVRHYKAKLARLRFDEGALSKTVDILNMWAANSENLEDHTKCFKYLVARAEKYLRAEKKNTADAL